MYNFRTDLALERRDIYQKVNNLKQIDGIKSTEEEINEKLKVTRVEILNKNGEKAIGKPVGNYVTIDVKKLKLAEDEDIQKASEVVTKELKKIINIHTDKQGDILVVGLGNIYVTPDALGPKVINEIDVTRHIIKYLPQYVDEGTRPVSAISPGVLGTTGIETVEILKGIVDNIHPKLLIVIDALASISLKRLNHTIQINNASISPGAGIGNFRKKFSQKTLGCPMLAIGVPTVVDIKALFEEAFKNIDLNLDEVMPFATEDDMIQFMVTPKEIDMNIDDLANIISRGLNKAFHNLNYY